MNREAVTFIFLGKVIVPPSPVKQKIDTGSEVNMNLSGPSGSQIFELSNQS
jgi:hypothetical protein